LGCGEIYHYAESLGRFQNDSLGRAWLSSKTGGGESWTAPSLPGGGAFKQALALGPGSTIRVEVDVGPREASKQTAEKMASSLHARGLAIGKGGWLLKADHTKNTTPTDSTDGLGNKISVATLEITWRLFDPQGNEAWQGRSGGKFDPFNSKYVAVGSRKTDMAPGGMGGGSTQVRLDYGNKDAMTAQLEEILEKNWYPGGPPPCLVKTATGYTPLPLAASPSDKPKP
jgi:hypothetical protein